MDSSIDSEFNISSRSFMSGICVAGGSTPETTPRKARNRRTQQEKQISKVKTQSQNKRIQGPVVGTCHCGKVYRSVKYFQRHKLEHKLKEESSKFPNKNRLLEAKDEIAKSALVKLRDFRPIGRIGREVMSLVDKTVENFGKFELFISCVFDKFVDKISSVNFCMPSALLSNIQSVVDDTTSDDEFRKLCEDSILSVVNVSKESFYSFFVDFVFKLGSKMIHFIAQSVMASSQSQSPIPLFLTVDERQTMHYVAGAIIRQYLRKARRFKNNKFWTNIETAIKRCVLEGDVVGVASNCDRYWTEFCNRGALNFVGPLFLDFIVALVHILVSVERPNGSLFHEDVQQELLKSPACSLWDKMIGNHLDEDDSIIFMRGVVHSFTATYGRGTSLKLMNQEMERPKVTVPLRKRLAAPNAQQY